MKKTYISIEERNSWKKVEFFEKIISIFLFVLMLFFVSKYYISGSSCDLSGCKAAGELVKFPQIYLEWAGLLFSSFLIIFNVFMKEEDKGFYSIKFYRIVIFSAFLFESIIFFYQLKSGIFCPLCFTVFSSIVILAFLEIGLNIFWGLIVIFIALSILKVPSQSTELVFSNKYTLISSKECPHCKKVKKYMFNHMIDYSNYDIKEYSEAIPFLKKFQFRGIPVLVVKESTNYFLILYGDKKIIEYFEDKNKLEEPPTFYDIEPAEKGGCMLVNPSCSKEDLPF